MRPGRPLLCAFLVRVPAFKREKKDEAHATIGVYDLSNCELLCCRDRGRLHLALLGSDFGLLSYAFGCYGIDDWPSRDLGKCFFSFADPRVHAEQVGKRPPSTFMTYGWVRCETIGALMNAVFLLALCFTILVDAAQRFANPEGTCLLLFF